MATATLAAGVITFTGSPGDVAVAQSIVTTTEEDDPVSFEFEISRRALTFRVGTTAGAQDIVADTVFLAGFHVVTFTPAVATYYVQFELAGVGTSKLNSFVRLAPGLLEITSPYRAAALPTMRWAQSLNTMWITGGDEEMHVFERRGQNSWSLRPFLQIDGPFASLNLSAVTMMPSNPTGTPTITASSPVFRSYDEGAIIRLTHAGQFVTEDLSAVDQVTDSIEVTGVEGSRVFAVRIVGTFVATVLLERSIGNEVNWATVGTYTDVTAIEFDDDLDNQVVYYRLRCSAYTSGAATSSLTYAAGVTNGVAKIVRVDTDIQVTVDVISAFGAVTATTLWSFGEWSERFGQPTAVALFDGRLWVLRGNSYWGSASDNFGSFATGPLASDAIGRTFGGNMASARWAVGASRLLVGLSGFESEIGSNSFDEVLKPENVRARNKSTKGAADSHPIHLDDAALFINRSRQRIYRFGYSNQNGDMATMDLTRMHREIASTLGFVEMAWQQEPEPRLWCVRGDGEVGALVLDLDEGVVAWCRLNMRLAAEDGVIESVCGLPTDDAEDEVYFVVRRIVGDATVRHVERLAPEAWDTISEAWRLHDALEYSGVSTSTFTGLTHLEGRTDVYVWANGQEAGPLTVTSGSITLPFAVTYAIAGLKYSGRYKSGRLAWGARMGASLVANKQLEKLGLVIHRTAGGSLKWGTDFTDMERLDDRIDDGTLTFDSAVQAWNGDFEFNVHGWTERDTRLHIEMDTAGPATVLALVETMKVNG